MALFKIHYSCGCGDNEDVIEAETMEDAEAIAEENAFEDYESYAGLHGILGREDMAREYICNLKNLNGEDVYSEDIADEELDELGEGDWVRIEEMYMEEIYNTIDYWAEPYDEDEEEEDE